MKYVSCFFDSSFPIISTCIQSNGIDICRHSLLHSGRHLHLLSTPPLFASRAKPPSAMVHAMLAGLAQDISFLKNCFVGPPCQDQPNNDNGKSRMQTHHLIGERGMGRERKRQRRVGMGHSPRWALHATLTLHKWNFAFSIFWNRLPLLPPLTPLPTAPSTCFSLTHTHTLQQVCSFAVERRKKLNSSCVF